MHRQAGQGLVAVRARQVQREARVAAGLQAGRARDAATARTAAGSAHDAPPGPLVIWNAGSEATLTDGVPDHGVNDALAV